MVSEPGQDAAQTRCAVLTNLRLARRAMTEEHRKWSRRGGCYRDFRKSRTRHPLVAPPTSAGVGKTIQRDDADFISVESAPTASHRRSRRAISGAALRHIRRTPISHWRERRSDSVSRTRSGRSAPALSIVCLCVAGTARRRGAIDARRACSAISVAACCSQLKWERSHGPSLDCGVTLSLATIRDRRDDLYAIV
jgi:hypothetical protein